MTGMTLSLFLLVDFNIPNLIESGLIHIVTSLPPLEMSSVEVVLLFRFSWSCMLEMEEILRNYGLLTANRKISPNLACLDLEFQPIADPCPRWKYLPPEATFNATIGELPRPAKDTSLRVSYALYASSQIEKEEKPSCVRFLKE